ncbi:hypothetical protein EPIR_1410 [Erwinia piriflorinigrans CFBP 5888]|uniref:Uncharacterized protein n=1 Tax=Erwinia piriflorinigrans CFBP 5888 TaxID=1161919 RepID=V5Z6W9_9GAMM|nr:hypothetical protein EPIR_1410 [Erwinia piriflorinigrans CFBP 5888]
MKSLAHFFSDRKNRGRRAEANPPEGNDTSRAD